jgi:hypothetical protein
MIRHTRPARRPATHPTRRRGSPEEAHRRAGRAFESAQAPLIDRVLALLTATAPDLGRWLTLGLALLTVAMLQLWRGARSGHGWLTLCALSRTLPLDESEKARATRLYRLLRNPALDGTVMTPLLVRIALGPAPQGWIPIVVDRPPFHGGAAYRYFAVPRAVLHGLLAADSKGAYFNRHIRNRYSYQRVA